MNTPHTPPWHVAIGDPSHGAVAYWVSPSSIEESQAHRAIIEQAPSLLAQRDALRQALQAIVDLASPDLTPPSRIAQTALAFDQARAALALVQEAGK